MAAIGGVDPELRRQLMSLGATPVQSMLAVVREARAGVVVALVAGFGGIISEVGAVMLVGGNIEGATRVLTTAIVLETRQGQFDRAIALGIILLAFLSILLLSNVITALSTFFLAKDLDLLVSAPIGWFRLYLCKLGETMLNMLLGQLTGHPQQARGQSRDEERDRRSRRRDHSRNRRDHRDRHRQHAVARHHRWAKHRGRSESLVRGLGFGKHRVGITARP